MEDDTLASMLTETPPAASPQPAPTTAGSDWRSESSWEPSVTASAAATLREIDRLPPAAEGGLGAQSFRGPLSAAERTAVHRMAQLLPSLAPPGRPAVRPPPALAGLSNPLAQPNLSVAWLNPGAVGR